MFETFSFPVKPCSSCARDVLVARELDDADEWVEVCTRCGTALDASRPARAWTASALSGIGYDVEGESAAAGCGEGGGGCSSCATSCST